jgi:isopenicillin-N epimerase
MEKLREKFLLDPSWTFLNHGSFGACPKVVFGAYQDWQLLLERQPVEFLYRNYHLFLDKAREDLAAYLGTTRDRLVFVHNATTGVNIVLNSLVLNEGDEILTTDWEYGACVRACEAVMKKSKARLVMAEIDASSPKAIVDSLINKITDNTKLLMVSEITSTNAFVLPVAEIVKAAHERGVWVLVDGAHVPGQNPLHLDDLGADFYTGNCHKWMMAPKGCAFLYVKPELQEMIQPLVVSWGWGEVCEHTQTNQMVSYLQYSGTQDPATWLSISATIDFMKTENWDQVRLDCKRMVDENRARFDAMLGQGSAYGFEEAVPNQMFCSVLPADADLDELRKALVAAKIEVPLTELNGKKMVRVSVQGYVTQDDIDRLYDLLKDFFEK